MPRKPTGKPVGRPSFAFPPEEELRRFYLVDRISTRALAIQYGVSQPTVRRWMDYYGIAGRPYTDNPIPTQKGGTHHWGPQIREALVGNPKVGQGNKGHFGENAPNWKGGTKTDKNGRVHVWVSNLRRYVPRAVVNWQLAHPGEEVGRGHLVHHIDSDHTNDDPANLMKLSTNQHIALHRKEDRGYIANLEKLLDTAGIAYPPKHEVVE